MKNQKTMNAIRDIADRHASEFNYESAVRFQKQLAEVVLPTSAMARAKALEVLLKEIAFGVDPEFVEFLKTR